MLSLPFSSVRPAGRNCLKMTTLYEIRESVEVLYTPDRGKC